MTENQRGDNAVTYPQLPGNRSESPGDAPTRLDLFRRYEPPTVPSWDGSDRDATQILGRINDAWTEVIPAVPPAQPEQPAANDSDPWKECMVAILFGMFLAAVVFVSGVVVGAVVF